jgi:hypothetical protein
MVIFTIFVNGDYISTEEVKYVDTDRETCFVMREKCDDVVEEYGIGQRVTKISCVCQQATEVPVLRADSKRKKIR